MTTHLAGSSQRNESALPPHADDPREYNRRWMADYRARQKAANPPPPKPAKAPKLPSGTIELTCVACGSTFRSRSKHLGPQPRCNACRETNSQVGKPGRHVIATVRFRGHPGPSGTAPVECTCSWVGTVDDWLGHRRSG